jgi:hypothetical protein
MVKGKIKGSYCGMYLNMEQKVVWFAKFRENLRETCNHLEKSASHICAITLK